MVDHEFEKALQQSKELPQRPSNQELLKLYALYKQGSKGDNHQDRPVGFDFKAIAKYEAWEELKGKSPEKAQKEYIQLVKDLQLKYA